MKHVTELNISLSGQPVGVLAKRERQYWFQYDAHWLQHGFNLAPQMMQFNHTAQLAKSSVFQGLHGVFYDSLPDGWGLLLMDRFFKQKLHCENHEITPLDRLAYLGKRAMGALEYEPCLTNEKISNEINLSALTEEAEKILSGNTRAVLNQLRILGGSPGGARPKVTLAFSDQFKNALSGFSELPPNFSHWLVKFKGHQDTHDAGRIEKTYSDIAEAAGIIVPENTLIKVSHKNKSSEYLFASKRFDRTGSIKHHIMTLCGYLYADFRLPSLDYNALLTATAVLTKDVREVERAFQLMIFNIVMHNKDDHAKNFSFVADNHGNWKLSPAYDLTFNHGMNNEHTTAVNGAGNPTKKDIESIANAHAINNWETILRDTLHASSQFPEFAKINKITKIEMNKIKESLIKISMRLK